MAHLSENAHRLTLKTYEISHIDELIDFLDRFNDVCIFILPENTDRLEIRFNDLFLNSLSSLGENATFIVVGEIHDLAILQGIISDKELGIYQQIFILNRNNTFESNANSPASS